MGENYAYRWQDTGAQPILTDEVHPLEDSEVVAAVAEATVHTAQEDGHIQGLGLVHDQDRLDDDEDPTLDREADPDLDPTKADHGPDRHLIPAQVAVNTIVEAQPHRVKEVAARREAVVVVDEVREAVVQVETIGRVVLVAVVLVVRPGAAKVVVEAAKDEAVGQWVVELTLAAVAVVP